MHRELSLFSKLVILLLASGRNLAPRLLSLANPQHTDKSTSMSSKKVTNFRKCLVALSLTCPPKIPCLRNGYQSLHSGFLGKKSKDPPCLWKVHCRTSRQRGESSRRDVGSRLQDEKDDQSWLLGWETNLGNGDEEDVEKDDQG